MLTFNKRIDHLVLSLRDLMDSEGTSGTLRSVARRMKRECLKDLGLGTGKMRQSDQLALVCFEQGSDQASHVAIAHNIFTTTKQSVIISLKKEHFEFHHQVEQLKSANHAYSRGSTAQPVVGAILAPKAQNKKGIVSATQTKQQGTSLIYKATEMCDLNLKKKIVP